MLVVVAILAAAQLSSADLGKLKWGMTREEVVRDVPGIEISGNSARGEIEIGQYRFAMGLHFTPLSGSLSSVALFSKDHEACDPLLAEYKAKFGPGVEMSLGADPEKWEFSDLRGNTRWNFTIYRVREKLFGCAINGVPLFGTSNAQP